MSKLNGKREQARSEGLKVNVAILGAGSIANAMAETLNAMTHTREYGGLVNLYAVAARDAGRAAQFASRYGLPVSYGSYAELLADPDVDLIYIATPHSLHAEQGLACIEAGKNILVEKAFTANASQAQELLTAAERSGLLCTEAIWPRYMPSRAIIDDILESGAIGEVKAASANLGYPTHYKKRITDPNLAGGALLDVGVYTLNFVDMALSDRSQRHIDRIETSMLPYETGVDAHDSITLYYDDGVMATNAASMLAVSDRTGTVWGTDGYLIVQNVNNPESIDVFDKEHHMAKHYAVPRQLTGYEYEVAAAANAVLDGETECTQMPHADTLRIMELMDSIRGEWGLKYPFE
ncbi:Gfo/Idh/MocA family protein [Bifidobacterium bombi]|uniref:NAD-dependent oxidoreductase n=1 Tax=Bifidobacterium bombi DSM 19703 TaxID=1341695 RepID=A0A080N422_9BIFI|nr:Gfo/Idh/MocA family oxidoreductase [Bifidobacterium bombi]KFF30985.1 NAD-dependent oxidoreductase [Bifidobacterium bombi DSM 19703]